MTKKRSCSGCGKSTRNHVGPLGRNKCLLSIQMKEARLEHALCAEGGESQGEMGLSPEGPPPPPRQKGKKKKRQTSPRPPNGSGTAEADSRGPSPVEALGAEGTVDGSSGTSRVPQEGRIDPSSYYLAQGFSRGQPAREAGASRASHLGPNQQRGRSPSPRRQAPPRSQGLQPQYLADLEVLGDLYRPAPDHRREQSCPPAVDSPSPRRPGDHYARPPASPSYEYPGRPLYRTTSEEFRPAPVPPPITPDLHIHIMTITTAIGQTTGRMLREVTSPAKTWPSIVPPSLASTVAPVNLTLGHYRPPVALNTSRKKQGWQPLPVSSWISVTFCLTLVM